MGKLDSSQHTFLRVFCINIAKSKLNLLYRYCLKLIGELRKEKEFGQHCCRNSTKIGERKRKRWREKEEEFRQHCYRNSCLSCVLCAKCHCWNRKKKKIFFGNCGNGIAVNGKKIEWNYGNVIAENGRKKKIVVEIWEEI